MTKAVILIVDDEPLNLTFTAEKLSPHYNVRIAKSGDEALAYLSRQHADLILLDINMPGKDGFEVCEIIKNDPKLKDIPIIFLTAENSPLTVVKAFDSGAVDYILKPFEPEELLIRVKTHIKSDRLQKENLHLLDVVNHYVAFIKIDLQGKIIEASDHFCSMFHIQKKNLIGENISILKSGHTSRDLYDRLWRTLKAGGIFHDQIENKNFLAGTNWYDVTIISESVPEQDFVGYIAFYRNIDEKILLEHDARTDKLTGLLNRAKIDDMLLKEAYRSSRYDTHLSLILIDIDFFKTVNDEFGHHVGDTVLQEFSALIRNHIRQEDILGRWGGEEFMVICPETSLQGAFDMAEHLRKLVEEYTFTGAGKKTASFGIVEYRHGEGINELFERVDQALYEAKSLGRNRSVCERPA